MNVLLAEANVPYDELYEMDEINPEFPQTDVVLVDRRERRRQPGSAERPGSPIYGMPILDVDKAHRRRRDQASMATGFAGIDNPLFLRPEDDDAVRRREGPRSKLVAAVKAV